MNTNNALILAAVKLGMVLAAWFILMVSMTEATAATCPCTIWPATATPANPTDPEAIAIELGVKFKSDVNGNITGIRFYKGSTNTGTHTGSLWTAGGVRLAQATFTNETATGWQQVNFASPVAITAGTTYVASYYAPNGHYAVTEPYFANGAVDNAPLHAIANSVSANGVYRAGVGGGFPVNTYNSTNYWVDVVFTTPVATLTSIAVTPANPTIQTGATQQFTATGTYSDNTTKNLTSQVAWTSSNTAVATVNATGLAAAVSAGTSTISAALSGVTGRTTLTIQVPVGANCPCTIWPATATPANPTDPEAIAIELGVKFKSDVNGNVTGIRFYKGSTNTGTHTGSLWTAGGIRLAQATFTNETATGWQQVNFASPVAITAGTTYVASYYAPSGHYAVTEPYFANGAVDNAPLHAIANSVSVNGVYKAAVGGGFPVNTFNSTNYWVDVVFATSAGTLSSIAVTPANPTIQTGTTQEFTATGTYSDNTTRNLTSQVTWTSSNTAVATVNATGLATAVSAGTSTISAALSGKSGNTALTASGVDIRQQLGQWSAPITWPLVTLNVTLLRTGEVLLWDGGAALNEPEQNGGTTARLWNPVTQAFTSVPNNTHNLFCSAHCALPDGRVFVAGGHDAANNILGTAAASFFNPSTRTWSSARPMAYRRWYPTTTCLPNGNVLVTSGSEFDDTIDVETPEIYNPASNTWTQLSFGTLAIPLYPYTFVLPDGQVLNAGSYEASTPTDVLNLATKNWTSVDPNPVDGGSAVMYLPGKVMKSGTAARVGENFGPASNSTYVLDMTQPAPAWRQTASMNNPRSYHTLTLLPDGTTLATGGGRSRDGIDTAQAVYQAEIWSPVTETWRLTASMQRPRLYHSTALLLPDGRVLVAGGGRNYVNSVKEFNAEIYSPPYLFKGSRPTITTLPSSITFGSSMFVQTPDAANIASVALVRPGSMTHSFNQDQRFLPLTFQVTSGGLTVTAPNNANLAPPGYYMLFLINSNGVPSVASFIKIS